MAAYKIIISAVALTAFTATGAFAQDHHRDGSSGQRAQPAQHAQQARPQAQPRAAEPRREEAQPRAADPRREEAQPRAADPRREQNVQTPRQNQYRGDARPDYRTYSGDRAAPRTYATPSPYAYGRSYSSVAPRVVRPNFVEVSPYRPYVYRPSLRIGVYYGYDGYYPYGYTPEYYFNPIPGHLYGGLRITGAPRDAQVFADGYYVGIVNDFDGIFQHLNLEAGPHHIEINEPGLQPVEFDVNIEPGRTVTFRADPYMFQP